jgi:hypothetical protein
MEIDNELPSQRIWAIFGPTRCGGSCISVELGQSNEDEVSGYQQYDNQMEQTKIG